MKNIIDINIVSCTMTIIPLCVIAISAEIEQ